MNLSLRLARSNMSSVGLSQLNDYQDTVDNRLCSFTLLSGECIFHEGLISEGSITITNYRLVIQRNETIRTVTLGVIEQTEVKKISTLHISCKDAKTYKCTFVSTDLCMDWQRKIEVAISGSYDIANVFASVYYKSLMIDNLELFNQLFSHSNGMNYSELAEKCFLEEGKRLKFDFHGAWRISAANEDYRLCSSYPRKIIVPSSISDNTLEGVAKYRSSKRIPAVVWRHSNGAIIARSSQPEVGWLGWRSPDDENLIKALSEACAYDSPLTTYSKYDYKSQSGKSINCNMDSSEIWLDRDEDKKDLSVSTDESSICDLPEAKSQKDIKKLLIIDARSYTTAVANRARGGGCECPEYYPSCEILFMNLDNIHTIRKAHHALRQLISLPADIPNWFSLLENTRWLAYLSGLLKTAVTVAQTIAIEARPVLVHCSDGWDRTPQITSLAEILMDPYYRTMEGFQILVDREWIEFGHKFSDRCGCGSGAEDIGERSPIFLQWLDCVYQLILQFPIAFQFNELFLVKLSQHVYSNMFGTFLFNSSQERALDEKRQKLFSVWALLKLNQPQYVNRLYNQTYQVLEPSCHSKDLQLWKAVYTTKVEKNLEESSSVTADELCNEFQDEGQKHDKDLVKTKSCDDLALLSSSPGPQIGRRSSDPSLRDGLPDMAMLKSALGAELQDDNSGELHSSNHFARDLTDDSNLRAKELNEAFTPSHMNNIGCEDDSNLDLNNCKPDNYDKVDCTRDNTDITSCHSNLESCRKTIEGSTDTLVNECGALCSDEPAIEKASFEFTNSPMPVMLKKAYSPKEKDLSFTNNQLLNHAARKLGHPAAFDTLASEERFQESNCGSSITECSTCYQSRKLLNDSKNLDIMKGSFLPDTTINGIIGSHKLAKGTRYSITPGHSRSPSSGVASTPNNERAVSSLFDKSQSSQNIDGLPLYSDEVSRRLEQIQHQHQVEVEYLSRELQKAKVRLNHALNQNKINLHNQENHSEDQVSLPESVGSSSGGSVGQESGVSDASWEAVEEGEFNPTLWLPDHAVESCMSCNSSFWIGRRKHHCRSCGKIFCAECSGNCVPIPKENLYDPVRVCRSCYNNINDFKIKTPITVASN